VVQTNASGLWTLPLSEAIFVIKPANYSVPLNNSKIPQHFRLFKSADLLKSKSLSDVHFALHPQAEDTVFNVLLFGDPQARGLREVNFIMHDVVEECIGTDAAFGVSLGDIVADDPNLFKEISEGIAQIGVPWYNVFGNHDSDRGSNSDELSDETFEQYFGPSTYAFEYGEVAFINLKNIFFNPKGKYKAHFTEKQLTFVKNYLSHVPKNKLVVLMMHAPMIRCGNSEKMLQIIADRPNTFSIAAHWHDQAHLFLDKEFGWHGAKPHHHFVNATVSGSWWCGMIDEMGIPHATMNDGGPNGYSIATFSGNQYSIRFKAARRPADYQMNIYLPDEIPTAALDTTNVLVNVFAGSDHSKVKMRVGSQSVWQSLSQVEAIDPACLRMHNLSTYLDQSVNGQALETVFGWKMDYPHKTRHMWQGKLPADLKPGTYTVTVCTTDMFNQTFESNRILRIR